MLAVRTLLWAIRALFRTRTDLALENLALRQQLIVLRRAKQRPRLRQEDRVFWLWLERTWKSWQQALLIVKPETVVRWHRRGFRYYWAWKSRRRGDGRPAVAPEIRRLIRQMSQANSLWGAPRIHGELLKLGIDISQATVAKYMDRSGKPSSPTWRAFLANHAKDLVAIDFFTVSTISFRVLYVFLVLSHDRRRILHVNVTTHPSAEWTGRQLVQAFPWDTVPRYLIRDRDGIFGDAFTATVRSLRIEPIVTSRRSPWQNGYVERVIGSIRRECLDHVIILGESHLLRVLREYVRYYHASRTHLSLAKDAPETRAVEPPELGPVVALPEVGGLHHRYTRHAA